MLENSGVAASRVSNGQAAYTGGKLAVRIHHCIRFQAANEKTNNRLLADS